MIKLHHVAESRSMRVLWMLHELNAEFEVINHPFDKSLRDPLYLSVHPAGRVPALEIDGIILFESGAALEYLAARFGKLGRVHGDDDWPEWLNWVHFAETISQHAAALTQQHVVIYPPEKRSALVTKLEPARLRKLYHALEERLKRHDFLLGPFSAADIAVGQALYMAVHFARLDGFTHLQAYYTRLCQRPAFIKSLPAPDDVTLYKQAFYEALDG